MQPSDETSVAAFLMLLDKDISAARMLETPGFDLISSMVAAAACALGHANDEIDGEVTL